MSDETKLTEEEIKALTEQNKIGFIAYSHIAGDKTAEEAAELYKKANAAADTQLPVLEKKASALEAIRDKVKESFKK